ncbi:MAG: DNA repair protein RecN [Oscillospiraceae bacterium]|jgi:DNA repair protein RecN (Recombination protein N)|nr:DNA repair protein RecN [Oscillospiraceae bacterium]
MLQELHIENIAVISRADVNFTEGLNVFTGETGAGKSIVIDALQAVLGARVSRDMVRAGADKALCSACFITSEADEWLGDNDIVSEGELIITRRISADGKSSARVCGAPITAGQLRELSELLLDIHGQSDGRLLMDERTHRRYLDGFGELEPLLEEYSRAFSAHRELKREIDALTLGELEKERLAENLKAQIEELEAANLQEGEEERRLARRSLLRNAEKLSEAVREAFELLSGDDEGAISLVQSASIYTGKAEAYCPELESVSASLKQAEALLFDASETLRDTSRELDFSPEEYDALESRLAELKRLQRRYGGDVPELLRKLERAKARLDELEYSELTLRKLEAKRLEALGEARSLAGQLTKKRREAALNLERAIVAELSSLNMPSVRFEVDITNIENDEGLGPHGADEIRFLMSANRGEKPGPISRVASGGELSRIMLAMKNVFSARETVETLVFDEVDAGVSGIAAQRVAEKLAQLSRTKQVLCVTHLPQLAAMADTHFLVEKAERDGRTFTDVIELDKDGRTRELARLHGGENVTENTLCSAREQLDAAQAFKKSLRRRGKG